MKKSIQLRRRLFDNKKTADELKKILAVSVTKSSDFPDFYQV